MDWPTLIETLKQIMQDDDIPVQQLADILGVSASSVRNYLSKRQRASIATREKLEDFVAAHTSKKGKETGKTTKRDDQVKAPKQASKRGRQSKSAVDKRNEQDKAADDNKTENKRNRQPKRQQGQQSAPKNDAKPKMESETNTVAAKPKRGRQPKRSQSEEKQQVTAKPEAKPSQQAATTEAKASVKETVKPVAQAAPQTDQMNAPTPSRSKTPVAQKQTQSPIRIYVDESFGQAAGKPFTVGMVLCNMTPGVMPFKAFTNTLYPFGWAPGDEVKAQGKDLANVKDVLQGSVNDDIRMMAFHTKMVPPLLAITDDDSIMVSIFPYLSALITAIERMQKQGMTGTQFQIIIDRTNKLPVEALHVMQHLLDVYFRLAAPENLSFHVTDGDSRAQKGLQLADFVSHYAYVEDPQKALDFDAVTSVLDDELANARRFAYYSGLRLVQIKPGAKTIVQPAKTITADAASEETTMDSDVDDELLVSNMSRAMVLILAYKETLQKADAAGLQGKQLEAIRSRLKGLSTTVVNWLNDEKAKLLNGLANRTISDFRERLAIITRVDKPFRPSAEIGEQQFRIFETQLGRIEALLDSYDTTAEKN